ncbi:uncharacterized protein LOC117120947 [Anneissia japonica]|uniref:uncharacterized protein LOC117120947 n=1 Tax=Anneissia japonica TaxID=1529436 RepID=UPI001425B46B|nr:uncharacterized protein LOC117120947 [Anneissia japonica]
MLMVTKMWKRMEALMAVFTTENTSPCPTNCSGHGHCTNGACVCMVQYKGGECENVNNGYFISFGFIFFVLCLISTIQLILCIKAEYERSKTRSLASACRITTQKLLYLIVMIATLSRGLYFSLQAFHIQDKEFNKPSFLSRSFVAFILFNIMLAILLVAQLLTTHLKEDPQYLSDVFNGCFACLMVIVMIFFLFYGVEVYFKVKGAFNNASLSLDPRTLHMSRIGLVFQGALQLLTAAFLMMSVADTKVLNEIKLRNFYDVLFRVVELGVAMWFPCVLWNCKSPEKLWILNPTRILRKAEDEENVNKDTEKTSLLRCRKKKYDSTEARVTCTGLDCWICYDAESTTSGPLIQPCNCKGDVAYVHHECLRRWLVETMENEDSKKCKVCKEEYILKDGKVHFLQGFQRKHAILSSLTVLLMMLCPICLVLIFRQYPSSPLNVVSIGTCILIEMSCLRYLGFSFTTAYNRAKVASLSIIGKPVPISHQAYQTDGSVSDSAVHPEIKAGPGPDISACPDVEVDPKIVPRSRTISETVTSEESDIAACPDVAVGPEIVPRSRTFSEVTVHAESI